MRYSQEWKWNGTAVSFEKAVKIKICVGSGKTKDKQESGQVDGSGTAGLGSGIEGLGSRGLGVCAVD